MLYVQNLVKIFNGRTVIKNLTLSIKKGEISVIVGPSGCGKSTLLNIIAGITRQEQGNLIWSDYAENQKIGYVFQEDRLLPWLTVIENVTAVGEQESEISGKAGFCCKKNPHDFERAKKIIEKTGLTGFENYYPSQLSGGMRQRCAIARAMYYGSSFFLMDEPFTSLDYVMRQKMICDTLAIHKAEKNTILFVTHDIEEALQLADTIYVLQKNPCRVLEYFSVKDFSKDDATLANLKRKILSLIA